MATYTALAFCLVTLALLLAACGAMWISGALGPTKSDFVPLYSAARLVWTGHAAQIYSLPVLGREEAVLVRPLRVTNGVMPYLDPPWLAVLLAPVGGLPLAVAYVVWLVVNLALLAAALLACLKLASLRRGRELFICATLASLPVVVCLAQGQTSIAILGALAGGLWCAQQVREVEAGTLFAFAAIKPTYVLPILALALLQRRARLLAGTATATACLWLLSCGVLGPGATGSYAATLREASQWSGQIGGFAPLWNNSLLGQAQLLLPSAWSVSLWVTAAALFAAALFLASRRPGFLLPAGLATLGGLLLSPHVLIHDLTLLVIPVSVALRFRRVGPSYLAAVLTLGYLGLLVGYRLTWAIPVHLSVVAMLALAAWLIVALGSSARHGRVLQFQRVESRPA